MVDDTVAQSLDSCHVQIGKLEQFVFTRHLANVINTIQV